VMGGKGQVNKPISQIQRTSLSYEVFGQILTANY